MASLASIRNKAAQYIAKGEYEKAVEEYAKALDIEPNDANTHNLLGEVYLKMNEREGAISEFMNAVELYTKDSFYTNAIAVCKKILRLDAEKAEIYKELGDLYTKQGLSGEAIANLMEYADRKRLAGDMDQVFATYQKTIELMPKKTDIRMRLVDMYLAQEKTAEAVEELKRVRDIFREQGKVDDADGIDQRIEDLAGAVEEVPAGVEEVAVAEPEAVPDELGEVQFEQTTSDLSLEAASEVGPGETTSALEGQVLGEELGGIEPMFKESPTDWASYVELGDLCFSIGSVDEAVSYYYQAADAYFEENSLSLAEGVYRKVADLRPFEMRPRQRLVQIALEQNDVEAAVEAYISLGDCLRRRGAEGEADSVYKKALKLDPENSLLRQRLAHAAEELGAPYPEEAVAPAEEESVNFGALLREELEEEEVREPEPSKGFRSMEELAQEFKEEVYGKITEGDYSVHYELGISYKEMGLIDEAIAEFQVASKGEEERLKSLEMLGLCLLERGDLELAEEQLKQGLGLPGYGEEQKVGLHYNLATVYERTGRAKEARRQYERVAAVDKGFKDVADKLAGVKRPEVEEKVQIPKAKEKEVEKEAKAPVKRRVSRKRSGKKITYI